MRPNVGFELRSPIYEGRAAALKTQCTQVSPGMDYLEPDGQDWVHRFGCRELLPSGHGSNARPS
jgi:hypothetical protein